MIIYTATQAKSRLIDQLSKSHKPIHISGKNANAVLISEEDWSAIQETLCLMSIPAMRKSIKKGLKIPLKKCNQELDW